MPDATTKVTVEVPTEAFVALRQSPEEFGDAMRLAAAVHWYTRGEVSMEQAARIAGLNRRDFLLALAARGVDVFTVDPDEIARELDRG